MNAAVISNRSAVAVWVLAAAAFGLVMAAAFGRGGEAAWAEGLIMLAGACGITTASLSLPALPKPFLLAISLWAAFVLWTLVQSLPLPALANPFWGELRADFPEVGAGSIALDPYAVRMDALRLSAYAGMVALGLTLGGRGWAKIVLLACCLMVAAFAAAGIAMQAAEWPDAVPKVRHAADATFPFSNRNTYCVFAGIAVILAAAALAFGRNRAFRPTGRMTLVGILAVAGAGVVASHSRAGLAAVFAGTVVAVMLASPPRRLLVFALAGAGLVTLASLAGLTGARAQHLPEDLAIRLSVWESSAVVALQHLWLGLGNLDQALTMHPGDWGERHILRAHNIYLQTIAERGLPATLAAVAAIALVVLECVRNLRGPNRFAVAAALGVTVMFGLHGLVDFSLYSPLNAALLALLLGIAGALPPPSGSFTKPQLTNSQ